MDWNRLFQLWFNKKNGSEKRVPIVEFKPLSPAIVLSPIYFGGLDFTQQHDWKGQTAGIAGLWSSSLFLQLYCCLLYILGLGLHTAA